MRESGVYEYWHSHLITAERYRDLSTTLTLRLCSKLYTHIYIILFFFSNEELISFAPHSYLFLLASYIELKPGDTYPCLPAAGSIFPIVVLCSAWRADCEFVYHAYPLAYHTTHQNVNVLICQSTDNTNTTKDSSPSSQSLCRGLDPKSSSTSDAAAVPTAVVTVVPSAAVQVLSPTQQRGAPLPNGHSSHCKGGGGERIQLTGVSAKKAEFKEFLLRRYIHVALQQEPKLQRKSESLSFPCYSSVWVDRPGSGGGLFAILAKTNISSITAHKRGSIYQGMTPENFGH